MASIQDKIIFGEQEVEHSTSLGYHFSMEENNLGNECVHFCILWELKYFLHKEFGFKVLHKLF